MYIIRCGEETSFEGWSERRRRGGKTLYHLGSQCSRFRGGGVAGDRRRDKDARFARNCTRILFREPRPAQCGGNYEKPLTKIAAVVTHCVFLLPLGRSSRRNKQDKEYRSVFGLHKVVPQPFHSSVQYYYHFIYDSRSKTLL